MPDSEAESKKAAAWLEGWNAAGGMLGWLKSGEKERLEAVISAQDRMIESLTAELAVKDRMVS